MKMNNKWKKTVWILGSIAGVYVIMQYVLPVMLPFLLGGLLAVWLHPTACFLEKKTKIKRSIWGGALLLLLMAAGGFLIWKILEILLAQAGLLFEKAGVFRDSCENILDNCCCMLERYTGICRADSREFLALELTRLGGRLREQFSPAMLRCTAAALKGSIAFITCLVLIFVFGVMVIKDLENWRIKKNHFPFAVCIQRIGSRLMEAGGGYLKAQLLIMLLVTAFCVGGLLLLRNPYFAVAGIIIGVLDALPFIGTGTVLVPWSVIWVIQGDYKKAIGYFLLYLFTSLLREFLEPRLIGKRIGLPPALILISVYLGIIIYGLSGFLLGPLTVLTLKILWEEERRLYKNDRNL